MPWHVANVRIGTASSFGMIKKFYERWRGIDKWPQTRATVFSNEVAATSTSRSPRINRITFSYRDANGDIQSGELQAVAGSSASSMHPRQTFLIRFNPAKPEQFYYAKEYSLVRYFAWLIGIIAVLLLIAEHRGLLHL